MAVIRVEKNRNFTTMSNVHLRDTNLSLKAKGLLSICLSLPDSWDYSVNGLTAICKEGRDAVLTTLQELERLGYVFREQTRTPDGRMGKSAMNHRKRIRGWDYRRRKSRLRIIRQRRNRRRVIRDNQILIKEIRIETITERIKWLAINMDNMEMFFCQMRSLKN